VMIVVGLMASVVNWMVKAPGQRVATA